MLWDRRESFVTSKQAINPIDLSLLSVLAHTHSPIHSGAHTQNELNGTKSTDLVFPCPNSHKIKEVNVRHICHVCLIIYCT